MDVIFFETAADWRAWLDANHDQVRELWVGYYKKATGKPTMTWSEAVDQALCYGWIDGIRKSIDDESYMNRFTPRKPRSIWSNVNVKRVGELIELGLMQPAGLKAFEARSPEREGVYSAEQGDLQLADADEQQFRANAAAWEFFQKQPATYRKAALWWIISAKKAETHDRRLAKLIDESAQGKRLAQFVSPTRRTS